MKEKIIEIVKKSSVFMLMFITLIILITTILFFVKVTITPWHLPIIYIVSIVAFMLFYKKDKKLTNIIGIILASAVFIIGILIFGRIYDSTFDGNTYHKLAIGSLKNGWNPVYENSQDFTQEKGNAFTPSSENINTKWVNHYPKATEIFGAVVYSITSNIESAKIFTFLFMFIVFGIVLSYVAKRSNVFVGILVALLLVVNPITMVQVNTLYVDSILGLAIILVLYCLNIQKNDYKDESKVETLMILASAILWSVNIKFTGLAYAGIFCGVSYLYNLWRKHKESKESFLKELKEQTIFYAVTVIIAVAVVGFSSYAKNAIFNGNLFYPLYGKDRVADICSAQAPKSFEGKNRVETFFISLFAKGVNAYPTDAEETTKPELKIPFTFTKDEIKNYNIPDIRMSGFGPLYSGIFILTTIGFIYLIIKWIKNKDYNKLIPYILLILSTGIILLIFEGNWWARYIAFIYVFPIIALYQLLKNRKSKVAFVSGIIFAIIISLNTLMVMCASIQGIKISNIYVETRLEEFEQYTKENENVKIKLNNIGYQGVLYNLNDLNILDKVTVDQEIDAERDGYMFNY